MGIEPVELIGKRAKLIPMDESHTADLFEAGWDRSIWTYMPDIAETMDDMRHLVSLALSARDKGTELPFVIVDQHSNKIVGSTRFLDISIPNRHLEVGWTWLSPSVWRTRINTECKYLLLRHGFEQLDMIRVQIKTDGRNVRSQQAIERIGGVKEGVLRKHRILHDGYVRDSVYYSVIAEEWPGVKSRLEKMLSR
ncbi:GNAT family N-acetyltransferase [Alicyclobacillus fodiniaquatilis]|uniref:GNAT family N-acetyltransferase n=1 Tax=Alicyclobacillus fodiniaquatilis TaxID=1661150 RepID=A0ABW4JHJ7_9BACL